MFPSYKMKHQHFCLFLKYDIWKWNVFLKVNLSLSFILHIIFCGKSFYISEKNVYNAHLGIVSTLAALAQNRVNYSDEVGAHAPCSKPHTITNRDCIHIQNVTNTHVLGASRVARALNVRWWNRFIIILQ